MRTNTLRTRGLLAGSLLCLAVASQAGEDAVTTFTAARTLAASHGTLILAHTTHPN